MNRYNSNLKQYSQHLILIALSDGKWHRNKELKEKTKLNPRTLSKNLKELEKELHWIEKRVDKESGEYPHPVLYRATASILSYAIYTKSVFENADTIEAELKETKDPFQILDELHKVNQYYFALILDAIQNDKHMTWKKIDWMTGLFLHSPYEAYTTELIGAFTRAVQFGTHFDIDQLSRNHEVPRIPDDT